MRYSTDCKEQVFRDSAFLGIWVVNVERHRGEVGFTLREILRKEAREMTACRSHPD